MTSSGFGKARLHCELSMRVSRFITAMALLAMTLFVCGSAFAGVTASISGAVKDATGAYVVGAKVTATNTETGIASRQPPNGNGYYSFKALGPGNNELGVKRAGY